MELVLIGANIKKYREMQNLTKAQLGERMNRTALAVRRYENDEKSPSLHDLKALANALNISVDTLIGNNENQSILDQVINRTKNDITIDLSKVNSFDDLVLAIKKLGVIIIGEE